MPARNSVPKKDHTEQPLFPVTTDATPLPDGTDSRQYNIDTGRAPDAPTQGSANPYLRGTRRHTPFTGPVVESRPERVGKGSQAGMSSYLHRDLG
jgi:hypothetical protein